MLTSYNFFLKSQRKPYTIWRTHVDELSKPEGFDVRVEALEVAVNAHTCRSISNRCAEGDRAHRKEASQRYKFTVITVLRAQNTPH
jgi:hypothetical protein